MRQTFSLFRFPDFVYNAKNRRRSIFMSERIRVIKQKNASLCIFIIC